MMEQYVFFLTAVAVSWVILNPLTKDGVIIKSGLILMAIGLFGSAICTVEGSDIDHSSIVTLVGSVVVILGMLYRVFSGKYKRRSDWLSVSRSTKP